MARSLLLTALAIASVELLFRSVGFRTPGLVLYPLVLYIAFHHGSWAGVGSAGLAAAYVAIGALGLGRSIGPRSGDHWRLAVVAFGIPAAAAVVGLLRDRFDRLLVLERAAREAATREREHNTRILDSITDGVIAIDLEWRITYANTVVEQMARRPRGALLGKDLRELAPGVESNVFGEHYTRALREQVAVHFEAPSDVANGWLDVHAYPSPQGLTIFFRDVTERHEHEEKLRSLSLLDELTGLYNRRGFFTLAQQHCKLAERNRRGPLLVFVDMDGLKQVNDTLGHVAGDLALVAVADALRHTFRESDILGRLGGDEFAALALETDPDAGPLLLERLGRALEQFNGSGTLEIPISVSIGTALFDPAQGGSVEDLLNAADTAMYAAKRELRGRGDAPDA